LPLMRVYATSPPHVVKFFWKNHNKSEVRAGIGLDTGTQQTSFRKLNTCKRGN
jgi:hypothetical protein